MQLKASAVKKETAARAVTMLARSQYISSIAREQARAQHGQTI